MNEVFLCLGGNLGNRWQILNECTQAINKDCGKISGISKTYETEAWGSTSTSKYLNRVIKIHTKFNADQLLNKLLLIEKKFGRKRDGTKNADRLADIDILFFNNDIINTKKLQIPHPRLHLRNFVLQPLMDIDENFIHPVLKKNIKKLVKSCNDKLAITEYKPVKYICIEGNIGSGKTTLAKALADKIHAHFLPEQFEKNDLLPLFYSNPKTFSFPLEYSFLLNRYQQMKDVFNQQDKVIIADYSIYKCLWFAELTLTKKDFKFFKKHFLAIEKQLPKPDMIIYLHTSVKNLKQNIKVRGRVYEKNISDKYLTNVEQQYLKGVKEISLPKKLIFSIKNYYTGLNAELITAIKEHIK